MKTAVLSYLDRENGEDPLLQQVRETIRKSVRSLRIVTDEQGPAGLNSTEFEESPVSPLDFLEELENDLIYSWSHDRRHLGRHVHVHGADQQGGSLGGIPIRSVTGQVTDRVTEIWTDET